MSVHSGRHGRINSNTPVVAHTKTKSNTHTRRTHSCKLPSGPSYALTFPPQAEELASSNLYCRGEVSVPRSSRAPTLCKHGRPVTLLARPRSSCTTHLCILRLQGFDALGYIPVIDVAAVHFHEMLKSGRLVVRRFERGRNLVMQRSTSVLVDFRQLQCSSYHRIAASGTPLSRNTAPAMCTSA